MASAQELFETGRAKFRERQFDEAVDLFRQAAELEPGTIEFWWNLGEACARAGKLAEMEAAFEKMIAIAHVHIGWAYFGRGRARSALGRPEQALDDFKSAEHLGADDFLWGHSVGFSRASEIFEHMAALYEKLGDLENAIRSYQSYQHHGGKTYNHEFAERHIRRIREMMGRGGESGDADVE